MSELKRAAKLGKDRVKLNKNAEGKEGQMTNDK
jgi:hypothetical protein